jgi:glutamate N-acetyltransferase/amino-acid N-acetyltransferase
MNTPKGYKFATAAAGFKKSGRRDLGLIVSEVPALGAATFTTNLFAAAPVLVGRELLARRDCFRAVMFNAGQANACTGEKGLALCRRTLELAGKALGLEPEEILPASTGVIGPDLDISKWEEVMPALIEDLGKSGPEDFAKAIMTTDSFHKLASAELSLAGGTVRLLGMAKGAGMICPNMATMLAVLLCDAKLDAPLWRRLVAEAVELSFNRVSVDGDTSTNDTLYALANGAGGVSVAAGEEMALKNGLLDVLRKLAYMLVQDGEGATKVIHIRVQGANSPAEAEKAARAVAHSQLVKTAMYGRDANWGRVIAALGRSGVAFDPGEVTLSMCGVELFTNNMPCMYEDDPALVEALKARDVSLDIQLGGGSCSYRMLTSDLTHKYVDINADYRS